MKKPTQYMPLREFRKFHSMTQTEFANSIGTNQANVAQYESGKRVMGVEMALRINEAFNALSGLDPQTKNWVFAVRT